MKIVLEFKSVKEFGDAMVKMVNLINNQEITLSGPDAFHVWENLSVDDVKKALDPNIDENGLNKTETIGGGETPKRL